MRRGELYRVYRGSKHDPKDFRVFIIISRQLLIDSKFSTVICAPVYSHFEGLSTQLSIGIEEGLKKESSVFCDEIFSIEKSRLTDFVGSLSPRKIATLEKCLKIAIAVE
ncbi:type II toxin-antitoxin system PemK/MazF family toxin [Bdellovibrionota bacterium FG-2]